MPGKYVYEYYRADYGQSAEDPRFHRSDTPYRLTDLSPIAIEICELEYGGSWECGLPDKLFVRSPNQTTWQEFEMWRTFQNESSLPRNHYSKLPGMNPKSPASTGAGLF